MGGIYNRYSSHSVDPRGNLGGLSPRHPADCEQLTWKTPLTRAALWNTTQSVSFRQDGASGGLRGETCLLSAYWVLDLFVHFVSFKFQSNTVV